MTLDTFTAEQLRALYQDARARADALHHKAARITLDEMLTAADDDDWRAIDARWHVVMAAGEEAVELMAAVTDELERRADERQAARDEH